MEECFVIFIGGTPIFDKLNRVPSKRHASTKNLTINKKYRATFDMVEATLSASGFYYTIVNDIGEKRDYYYTHFITLQKWRENQLNKIIE